MKYLLILLFSFAFGQTISDGDSITDEEWEFQLGLADNNVPEQCLYVQDSKIIELQMFLDYAEECYNDSVHVSYFGLICTTEYETDTSVTLTGICYPDSTINIYPTTPTFAGFIEWIREQ